jgi:HK97 family phage portal protein
MMGLFKRFTGAAKRIYNNARNTAVRAMTELQWSGVSGSEHPIVESNALSLAPLYACVRILAEQISSLPMEAYKKDTDHILVPVYTGQTADFASKPATYDDYVTWVRKMVTSLALRGNAYGLVVARNDDRTPRIVEWLHPDKVSVEDRNNDGVTPFYFLDGVPIRRDRIIHIQLFPRAGRLKSLSPIGNFAELIGHSLSAYRFGGSWFEHGGSPPATFQNTAIKISNADAEVMSRRLENALMSRRPIVYGADWKFEAIKVTPEESQFIETIKMNATTIASIYGIPPEMIGGETGGSLTYSTKAGDGHALYKFTIRPWLTMIEAAINRFFISTTGLRFNVDALIRSDLQSRYLSYQLGVSGGFLTPNEARGRENLPPIDGGDSLRAPKEGAVNGNQIDTPSGGAAQS